MSKTDIFNTDKKYKTIYIDPPWDNDYKPIILKANELLANNGVINMRYIGYDSSGHSVRCVYDEWYWEQTKTPKVDKTKFTWGDEPR